MSEPEGRAFRPKDIAIIGMSGRFPGARDINEFWRNQLNGVEAIRRFDAEPGNRSNGDGSSEGTTLVGARAVLDQADQFDADFFGMHPREAALTDPQHRIFLECCWEAFEDAGYEPGEESEVGVFAGCAMPTYFLSTLGTLPGFLESFTRGYQVENYAEMLGNSLDFLATRVSYKLDLRGPSFTLQAGCSTSLLAVCQACDALRNRHCELALAGGISITFPQMRAARYQDGGMISADGHCRAFDAAANGTVFGCGAGVVLLKRLGEAMRDGDHVYGVIRGYAVNNDGSAKAGYTAPSVEGQARVIAAAHRDAEVGGNEIGYIEAHGTGTPLGDPIELTALNQVFRGAAAAKNSCAIGTAKTNVGHLDVAAGITGLIHAVQILRHAEFPPTLHFHSSNGHFGMEESPFYVNQQRKTWPRQRSPRRAGVSSFGIGGTNAHVILEEKPIQEAEPARKTAYLLTVSARSEGALQQASADLASFLGTHAETNLADAAYTLHCGRKAFAFRRAVSVKDASEVMQALTAPGNLRGNATAIASEEPRVVFLFPGQGSQERGMASDIYENEKAFREPFDRCAEILKDPLRADLREIAFNKPSARDFDLDRTEFAQPAIFAVEYALAQLWESWGIRPSAMLGHSIGEYVAATLAGVMTLEDALALVAARGKLMQEVAPGAMLAVRASEASLTEMLSPSVSLAAVNSSRSCVVSGSIEAIEGFESQLQEQGVATRRLKTSHAFHSAMMDSVLERFTERARAVRMKPAAIPYVSCLTGNWITEDDLRNPNYWANHLRGTVRFASGLRLATQDAQNLLLEVGPGKSLAALVREEVRGGSRTSRVVSSVPDVSAGSDSYRGLLEALGWLWTAGADVDWRAFHGDERRLRVSLPTYPFERKRFWLDSPTTKNSALDGNHTEQGSIPVSTSPNTPSLPESSRPRTDERIERLRSDVMAILTNLSGAALSTAESSTTFLELGFDSLFLAQVSIALQKQFGVKVTFRQLLNDFSSAERLAAHLDGVLPRDVSKGEKPAAREDGPLQATPNREQALPASDAPVDSQPTRSPLQTLMQEQLRAMNELFAKQLEAMEKSGEDGNPRTALRQKSADVAQPTPACTPSVASAPDASRREQVAVEKAFTPHHPPATKHAGEWSNSQRAYLSKLIERYTKRTARSKALTQQYRRVLADPRVVSGFRPEWKEMVYPIVTIRSEGSHLWDVDGNEYIDLLNGFGPIFFGHRPESIERAVAEQLHQGFEIGPQSQLAGEVAALFCELTGNERMTFCNTGSEAVMAALRVSRTVTGRSKVVVFAGAYHGMFDEVLITQASGGSSVGALPIAPGIPQENLSNMVVLEYGSASALDWIRQHASELAAVLVEPVQSRHPALQPVEFLKELRGITAASGAALIFDEVVTGFRVHPGGCQALFGIRADLATYGKVLAGGLPIGVLAGRAEFMNALDGGPWQFGDDSYPEANVTFFAGTFVRHPLALAAAKATLGQLKSAGPKLQEDLARRTTRLAAALRATFEQQLIPAQIEDFTSLFYMQFPREFPYGSLLYYALREKGIYILEGFPSFLTTAHSGQDVARIEEGFSQAAEEMRAAGFYSKAKAPSPRLVMGSERSTEPQTVEVALTEAQMEILLAAQMSDGASCAFNESFTIRLCGTLDRSAFETALGELFARHDALRASISTEAQMLRFAKQVELPLRFQNLSGLSRSHADAAIADAVRSDALLPFDLAKPPLVRMTLFQLSATEHALLFTAHHVVCDGWSSNVLLSELATLYSAQISGDASELSPALQFSEYALRQAATRAKTEDREFWMAQFRDLVPVLELPTDRSRPVVKSFAGATARSDIERTLLERIKRASTSQGCTLFAALLAAFGALLHRLTSQDDIAIGIPFAGQSNLSECNLVGHCVNFLPIRMRWFEADTAADALQRVQRSLLDAQEHQDFTYGTLVRERNVPRQPGRLPLIEVQFNLEKIGGGLSFQGLQAEIETNPKAAVNFDLFLNAVETKNGLRLECDYNSDLFDERTIERWLSHYAVLLEGMASDQNQPISAQPLLTEAQRKQLISEWNATERDFPLDLRVYELFQTQAARTPEKIAVSGKGGALTYQQLEERSNQLARHLLKIGLQPSDLIGVALDRSINMLVTLLAVWKAGVAYVPLDPAYPQERIAFILEDASVPILITTSDLIERLPVCDARLVCLDRDSILIEREAASSPDPVANTQPLAYVIYTSGSTGRPKGVAVTQRNLVNLLLAMQLEPGITPEDRLLAVTTLSFDIAALELFLPIVSGAQVVLAAREDAADGRALRRLIQNENITMLQATPATWRLLLEAGWPEEHRLKMLCGGEALSRDLADALLPHGELWNMYGPTETTVWSAVSRVTRGTGSIPLGHPIANTQFYVLDSHQQLLPLGVAGELCIGGEGVAQGYFHRPDLTEKVFLPDPFHPNGQHRIYRTGDTVRCHADGTLEFLGRSDQQVKIRGFRVELQEVEAALNRHPDIRQAVAAGCNDEHGFKKLVAYVVSERPPEPPDPSELREWLRGHLPTYMIPSQYIFLDALPHTPNGKVDRKSLPHPEDAARLTDEFVPPRTPLEAQIASLCATVMQVDRIGVTTSLLDLGADSLHLFQIASRAAAAGLPVTAEQIMRLHTVEALAKEIGRTKESDSSFGALPPLAPAAREQFRVASAD